MKNIGYSINRVTHSFDGLQLQRFSNIPVSCIGDAMNRTACVPSMLRAMNGRRLQGAAYTVRVPAGDNLMFYYAIDNAPKGAVIVVDGGGYTERALCGEIMVTLAKRKELGGFVINGAIRDLEEIVEIDFPVFACAVSPNGPFKNGPGEINGPVNLCGRIVFPGDILIGDPEGVVCFHSEDMDWVLEKAKAVEEKEERMLLGIETTGNLDLTWVYEKLEREGCEIR